MTRCLFFLCTFFLFQGLVFSAPAETKKDNFLQDIHLRLMGRTFPSFHATWLPNQDFNEFEVHESVLGLDAGWSHYVGVSLRFEILRSAQPQSLFGIDGDSYILRLQRAWGYARYYLWIGWLEGRFGLIPDPWIDAVRPHYRMRGLRALLSESGDFFEQSDLGASVHFRALRGAIQVGFSLTNGEGLNRAEQNNGKNSTVVLSILPLRFLKNPLKLWGDNAEISIHAAYRDGSIGTGSARNHRIATAATFTSRHLDIGLEYIYAMGWSNLADRVADGLGVWARGSFGTRWIGAFVRYDRQNTNVEIEEAIRQRVSVGLYSDFLDAQMFQGNQRFRLYLAYQYETQGKNAMPLPGVPQVAEAHRVMVLLSIYLDARFNHKPLPHS
ncbi:MAG: hypothetical protein H6728_06065 [Myxococcales bacterium]|nr:hypothetical protein [Myxococcales bacterium]